MLMKNMKQHKGIKALLSFLVLMVLSLCGMTDTYAQTRNFVQEDVVRVAGAKTGTDVFALGSGSRSSSRTYFDGYGRASQSIAIGASPNQKDIVQLVVYDSLSRQTISYLPYAASTATGQFRSNAIAEQGSFYATTGAKYATDTKPYPQQVFDNSPLQRLLKSGSVGEGYQPNQHHSAFTVRTNLGSENIRRWNPDGTVASSFAAGTLSVEEATDEEGNQAMVYTDNQGQAVLKKQYLNAGGISYVETYYVYNDLGQLLYLIPPKAVSTMAAAGNYSLSQPAVAKLIFSYAYDYKGRPIEKTVPAGGTMYMVYDPLDRLVLAQDANMRIANKWNYIKYDSRDVPISQGIYTNSSYTTRATMQAYIDGLSYGSNTYEERNTSSSSGYYTNVAFPNSNIEPLAYSYFDDYDLDGNGTDDFSYAVQGISGEAAATKYVSAMPTMVRKRTVGSGLASIWLTNVMFYDEKGQLVQSHSNNQLNSTVASITTIVRNFAGETLSTKTVQVTSSNTTTVAASYGYDHAGRLLNVNEKYNSASPIRVAAYEYNELGQLVDRKLHSTNSGVSYLQSVDYRYTIKGQLKSINNSTLSTGDDNDDTNDIFGMELLYGTTDSGIGNTAYYNGQLSAVKWKVNAAAVSTSNQRSYKFSYDKLMRLTDAQYADRSGSGSWGNIGAFDEKNISFDENGNILTLKRNALVSGTVTEVDNLNYSYDGNQLSNVTDGSGGSYGVYGFRNLTASTAAYSYDANGNMAGDAKKGIVLAYNVLNRTERITITTATNRYIDYTYDAGGSMIRKQAYDNGTLVKTTDYIGGFVYEGGTLAYFGMAEGRVRNAGGTLTSEYMIKDQQGNVRVSFESSGGTAVVRQENSYYPYGLTMPGSVTPTAPNKNLYNGGSEWQDDFGNLPDLQQTFYRMYDAALGRFLGVDPVPEHAESMGTYQYAFANPVMFNDPLGDQGGDYYQNPTGGGSGGAQAVYFHGGYRRIGSGSGNNWSDGMQYSDWTAWGGSDIYRQGLAMGFQDIGGFLHGKDTDGNFVKMEPLGGEFGYFKDLKGGVTLEYYGENNEDGINGWRATPNVTPGRVWVPVSGNKSQPWMSIARGELGVKEATGNNDGKDVEKYLKSGGIEAGSPWCGSFVNWTMLESKIKVNGVKENPNWALNWRGFGQKLSKPAFGAIATMKRTEGGHVGFVAGITSSGKIVLLGGNQGDMVKYESFTKDMQFNYPNGFIPNYNLPIMKVGKNSKMN